MKPVKYLAFYDIVDVLIEESELFTGADLESSEGGGKPSSLSLKQGSGGTEVTRLLDCLLFNYQISRFKAHLSLIGF